MAREKKPSEATETAQNVPEVQTEELTPEESKAETGRKSEATEAKSAVIYTVDEFVQGAGTVFGKPFSPDIIRAAFFVAGITEATVEDAKKLVEEFAYKEVKE